MRRYVLALSLLAAFVSLLSPQPARASGSPVDDLLAQCPSAAEVATFNADLAISFEADPSAGTLVCQSSQGSIDLTRSQERVYQALRVMRTIQYSRSLPWTQLGLYDWFIGAIDGIRFRDDIMFSFCCVPASTINIRANTTVPPTNRWMADNPLGIWPVGLQGLVNLLVHEARHSELAPQPHTCGANDQTVGELGAWGTVYYLELWNALYSGSFLTSPSLYPSYYRDQHLLVSETILGRICSRPNADLSLTIGPPEPSPARRGQDVGYVFSATNQGPETAPDVFVYSPLPVGTTFVGATTTQGSCVAGAGGAIACSFGSVPPGTTATAEVRLNVGATTAGPITNKESAIAFGARVTGPYRDANPTNNSAFFSTPVVAPDIEDVVADLIESVESLQLQHGVTTMLVTQLRVALKETERDKARAACKHLEVFVSRVTHLERHGDIASADATRLIDAARLAQDVATCA